MEEVLKQLNELCRDTLVDNLGMVFTAAGKDGWKPGCLSTGVPVVRTELYTVVLIWLWPRRSEEL